MDNNGLALPSARAVMLRTEPQASPPSGFPSSNAGEFRYPLVDNGHAQWSYGDWRISYEPKPIPTTACDFDWWHDDFDGAPDAGDGRHGAEGTLEAAIDAIHEWEDDQ